MCSDALSLLACDSRCLRRTRSERSSPLAQRTRADGAGPACGRRTTSARGQNWCDDGAELHDVVPLPAYGHQRARPCPRVRLPIEPQRWVSAWSRVRRLPPGWDSRRRRSGIRGRVVVLDVSAARSAALTSTAIWVVRVHRVAGSIDLLVCATGVHHDHTIMHVANDFEVGLRRGNGGTVAKMRWPEWHRTGSASAPEVSQMCWVRSHRGAPLLHHPPRTSAPPT